MMYELTNDEILCNEIAKEAIKNHELVVYYQPQYDAINSKLISAEALVRWVQP